MADIEAPIAAPASYKQPSRKGKKAWRKNVDITEVQQGLEDVREEILKGGVVAEKHANELFATDTTGDADVAKKQQGKKLLKADEILALRSAVPGLEPHKKRKVEDAAVGPGSSKRVKNGTYVPHKELQRLRAVADGANGGVALEEHNVTHDPWAQRIKMKDPRFSFIDERKQKREPKTLKQAPAPLTTNGKQLPNIRKPDAGKSYNPLVGDWSALLEREGAAAVESEKARLAAESEQAAKDERAAKEAAKVEAAEREEYATDYDSAWESEWDGFQFENEKMDSWTQKVKGRKTVAEKNKSKTRKEREALERHERKQKLRDQQERRIAEIAKEVSARDKARRAHSTALQTTTTVNPDSDEDNVQLSRRRFGALPVPDAPLEVVLPDELEDSLRRLKPEGNLMQERYRNLLVSGKMEVRRKQWQHKVVKKKRTEKWSYKDWKLK